MLSRDDLTPAELAALAEVEAGDRRFVMNLILVAVFVLAAWVLTDGFRGSMPEPLAPLCSPPAVATVGGVPGSLPVEPRPPHCQDTP